MTSTALSDALEREHRAIDEGIESFANTRPADLTEGHRVALLDAVAVLRRHIYLEEVHLFPPLRAAGMFGPVMVMVHEHGQMWPILDQLDDLLATGITDTAGLLCRDLLTQLASHNVKEEQILYPQADDLLPATDRDSLSALLTTADIPAGWVCQGAANIQRPVG